MEVSAYLNETRVAFARQEKTSQISKIRHHLLIKSQAFQSYYIVIFVHSCFRGWHIALLYPAFLITPALRAITLLGPITLLILAGKGVALQ